MSSVENALIIVSFASDETPDLERWLLYHLSLGVDLIVVYQTPRMFTQPSDLTAFEDTGRVLRRQLHLDVGLPLKSSMVSAMNEDILPDDALTMALNVGEYLSIGTQLKPIPDEISAHFGSSVAWATPVVMPQVSMAQKAEGKDKVEFRTIFRSGAFRSHNGERPIITSNDVDGTWLDGAAQKIDPDHAFWGAGSEVSDETLAVVILLPTESDPLFLDENSRGLMVEAYANKQFSQRLFTVEQLKASGMSEDIREQLYKTRPAIRNLPEKGGIASSAEKNEAGAQQLPDWYMEICPSGTVPGFFKRLEHHSLVFVQRPSDALVVTFDNLAAVNDQSSQRAPWAYKALRKEGCAHLGVLAHRKDWFRDPKLIAAMESIRDQGIFREYKNVIFSGTSMGGFAALVFSSLSPGARVLAFSPQSTLNEDIVPWETRFGMGRLRNWRLPFSDAAFEIEEAEQVVIISDPYFELDQKHVDRLTTPNVMKLKSWFTGHFSPVFLNRADILKPVMTKMIKGSLTEEAFYRLYRERRKLPWYKRSLEEALLQKGHKKLALRVGPAFREVKSRSK